MDTIMNKRYSIVKIIICVFPFIAFSMVYAFKSVLINLSTHLPACPIFTYFDVYCPGCGNTRSVQCLLNCDIIGSLRFNITPIFGLIIGILAYIELVLYIFGKNIRILPRSRKFWTFIIIAFVLYFIIRNLIK